MKLLRDLSFLLKYFSADDLEYYYELLQDRIVNTVKAETVDNQRLSGYIWQLMSIVIERASPKICYTRMSKKSRQDFIDLASAKLTELSSSYKATMNKTEKDSIMLSMYSLKFLIAIAKQDDIF